MEKKVSIIVPCYGTEKYVQRCIDSLINQTYKNLEIILVNDASPYGMEKILEKYENLDERIKVINHKENKGLFHTRLTGADNSKGDYICFIDSDDYISVDYIRNLVFDIEEKDSDMVFSTTILEDKNKYLYNLFDFNIDEITGEKCIENYFSQKGLNYRWHTIWNKLYKKELWEKSRKYYDNIKTHLIMTEDFAFSSVLYYFCKKITFNDYAYYYYCSNSESSTSLKKANYNKFYKNINDIFTSFNFVKSFMKEKNIYSKYQKDFDTWYNIYLKIWYNNIINSNLENDDKNKLLGKIYEKNSNISNFEYKNGTNFYNATVKFNDGYEELINAIIKSETVSFDIFDTLILRPFYEPKDLFKLINKKYKKLYPKSNIIFSEIREESEKICRNIVYEKNKYEEITLDEIYKYINNNYNIGEKEINILKEYEISLEEQYCRERKSGKNLYNLAKYLNKRIIITSDIYLPKDVINNILKKNGYEKINKIYLSCEHRLSKATGNLYQIVLNNEKNAITHFGDNYISDIQNATKNGINSKHLPKATDVMWPNIYKIFNKKIYNIDTSIFQSFSGIRLSLALVANKFYDNPFVSFEPASTFNCNPAYIGYFALGMHSFAISKWIYESVTKNGYDSISFMARDGYLISKEFDYMKNYFNSSIKTSYVPISRKSLLPFSFKNKNDLIGLLNYFAYDKVSPNDIYKIIKPIMKETPNNNAKIFKTKSEFAKFITANIIPNIDEEKMINNRKIIKKYFKEFYKGKAANFDIGYSAKPERTLTQLLEKPIDTYFIHINNEEGFSNSNKEFKLNTFYNFKPKFTGLLREYILSELCGSCIKYDVKQKVTPVFADIEINYYEKWIIDLIQSNALSFTQDILKNYGEIIDEVYFPNLYMSIPFEYFMHSSDAYDRQLFQGLIFEDSVNNYIDIEKVWSAIYVDSFGESAVTYESVIQNFYNLQVKNRNKLIKLIYYTFFDRISLKNKVKQTLGPNNILTKTLKKIYKFAKKIKLIIKKFILK